MDRALRLWSAVSWWLVPVAIIAFGAVDLAQNGSLSSGGGSSVTFPGPVAVHAAFLLLVTVPLCWRFRAPVAVVILVTAGSEIWILTMFSWKAEPPPEPWLAILVAVFALASRTDGRPLWAGAVVASVMFGTGEIIGELAGQGTGNTFPALLFYALIFVLGRTVDAHRKRSSGQQDRAERLERDQQSRAARAVASERARIAWELHDVIAHSLSVIVIQAAAERRVLPAGREPTADVLEAIEQTGRQTMTELRRLLGLLSKSDGEPALTPQPGLSRLGDLVAKVREAGVEIEVRTEGNLAAIPKGLDLSAYRIVQESLTNVLKHAHAHRVQVSLRCRGRCVEIDITDDGTASDAPAPGGFGLLGMRERVTVYGGTVQAGPRYAGGYRVHVRLPFEAGELALP
jgi:signal transduction histidine kinase